MFGKHWLNRRVAYPITVYKLQKGSSKILRVKYPGCNLYLDVVVLHEFDFDCFMIFFST